MRHCGGVGGKHYNRVVIAIAISHYAIWQPKQLLILSLLELHRLFLLYVAVQHYIVVSRTTGNVGLLLRV